jgi:hypothetical protein
MFVSPVVWESFLTVADYIGRKIYLGSIRLGFHNNFTPCITQPFLLHFYIAHFSCINQYVTLVQSIQIMHQG